MDDLPAIQRITFAPASGEKESGTDDLPCIPTYNLRASSRYISKYLEYIAKCARLFANAAEDKAISAEFFANSAECFAKSTECL